MTNPVGRPPGSLSKRPTRKTVKYISWTAEEWARIEAKALHRNWTTTKVIQRAVAAYLDGR
jgi:hypothetical protein